MYKSELDKHIQNKTLSNSLVFFGESHFLIDYYTRTLSHVEDATILSFYHDEYDFGSAKAHLSQASLFGGRSVLVIKSEKKVPKKELDVFFDLCVKNPDNLFIYAYYGSDNTIYSKTKAPTMNVRFFHPNTKEAQMLVLEVAKAQNVLLDNFGVTHLLNIHNQDVALACNEIEKFQVYERQITTKDIDTLVYGLGEVNLDEFIKKLLNKKDFKEDLVSILERGEDEVRVLTAITSYITQLAMFNFYIRINGAPNALEILGYKAPNHIVEQKASQSIKIKPDAYYKLHELLLESELKIKSSHIDKNAILISTLIRMQQLL
ncbi:MAG: DNA polymerase III subunit delta [Sulfurimonadaceae bacterium]|jgi:DNA polymerase-3 subunit delta|nr:DNA polymerase III subunit delta [Sulfurimonadaceae bacterium]